MDPEVTFDLSSPIHIAEDITFRKIDEETILVNLVNERMFTLNNSGTRFWQLLVEGLTVPQIIDKMGQEYEIESADLENEVRDLIFLLQQEELVTVG